MTDEETEAYAEGWDAGNAAGSWVVDSGRLDSRTSETEYAAGILRELENGELSAPWPLSGEWADGVMPRDVLDMVGVGEDDPVADDVLAAYEQGFGDAWRERVEWDALRLWVGIVSEG